jgi:SAM-dependent methyltransferase
VRRTGRSDNAHVIELQRKLLGDRVRNEAFDRALRQVIVPGQSTVTDLGSGTGFLSFLAERAGAKHCYLYEVGEIAEVSRKLAARNGCTKLTISRRHTTDVTRPTQTDVVVAEVLGNYAFEEHLIEVMRDVHRFLKPGGTIIPQAVRSCLTPIVQPRLWDDVNVWDRVGFDLNLQETKDIALQNMYVRAVRAEDLWQGAGGCQTWDDIDLHTTPSSRRQGAARWTSDRVQMLYGFCLHWEATLVPGVELSTSVQAPATHWEQIYLPVREPLTLEAGDELRIAMTSDTRWEVGVRVTWTIEHWRQGTPIAQQHSDTAAGWLD